LVPAGHTADPARVSELDLEMVAVSEEVNLSVAVEEYNLVHQN
jgi:hypothetical protein